MIEMYGTSLKSVSLPSRRAITDDIIHGYISGVSVNETNNVRVYNFFHSCLSN